MITELTNNLRKAYASLATAKGRKEHGLFMAQGTKCVLDTLPYFQPECVLATAQWMSEHRNVEGVEVKKADLEKITTLSCAPDVIGVYKIPEQTNPKPMPGNLYLALDCVQDPGNLGTILRVADWMGIGVVYASNDTADVWNPKVVQATMGAIARVEVCYTDLCPLLKSASGMKIYGTFLDGDDIYKADLSADGIIVMGNEGNGISAQVEECVNERLLIPSYPPDRITSESLNVAVATSITLAEFRRRNY